MHAGRKWKMRLAAIGFGFAILGAIEGLCHLFNWGAPDYSEDPFVGFRAEKPLFQLIPTSDEYVTARDRQKAFVEERFSRKKPDKTFRIFCLGGSTVQGRPYSIETSFTTWLKISLQAAYPQYRWEVINAGGISYASYRLVPILDECLQYEPDLFIVGTGHNEFLEDRTYAKIKRLAGSLGSVERIAARSRLYQLMRRTIHSRSDTAESRPILKAEVDALLDYQDALAAYDRDPARRNAIIAHFKNNLQRMLHLGHEAEVPVIFLALPVNLTGIPPFKSLHREDLSQDELDVWKSFHRRALREVQEDPDSAIRLFQQCLEIDPHYADTYYSLGQCYLRMADSARARQAFEKAIDEDICPLRMIAPLKQALLDLSKRAQVIDVTALLARECQFNLTGDEILVDHVHPSIRGHQLIATELFSPVVLNLAIPHTAAPNWEEARDTAYNRHMESLKPVYFARGSQRLENLRKWTQGRTNGPSWRPERAK